ncbi:MAG: hypothetical protein AAFX76_04510 [Planctomycetota bacterium]
MEADAECGGGACVLTAGGVRVSVTLSAEAESAGDRAWRLRWSAEVLEGDGQPIAVGLTVGVARWAEADYVSLPGAVYAGNRFPSSPLRYPPISVDWAERDWTEGGPITDVPRLEVGGGGRVQQRAGDLATPSVLLRRGDGGLGLCLLGPERTVWGECGYELHETPGVEAQAGLGRLDVSVAFPGVREERRYTMCTTQALSNDQGHPARAGDTMHAELRLDLWGCPDVPALFDHLLTHRDAVEPAPPRRHEVPVSHAFDLVEAKTQRFNWREGPGFYAVGTEESPNQIWQPGWVGGLINTLPLLRIGDEATCQRVERTLDFACVPGQASSGFFYGISDGHRMLGDFFGVPELPWHLVRKSADVLYILTLHVAVLKDRGRAVQPAWLDAARRCADAFVELWERHGQLGQFVNHDTGAMIVNGSCSAAIVSAGLARLAELVDEPRYAEAARAILAYHDRQFVQRGVTTGGPGEAAQCPEYESCFGQLEAAVVLYELTGDPACLAMAKRAADLGASWVIGHDYAFPEGSEFHRLNIPSVGGVMANAQNKCGAPGICTLSGVSLLRLYRGTGRRAYVTLLGDIGRCLAWCTSRPDRPIISADGKALPSGWINERINTGDWDNRHGGVFHGSTWCEAALLLTHTEVPGVYVDLDRRTVDVLDHLDAEVEGWGDASATLRLTNPTAYTARVSVLAETAAEQAKALGHDPLASAHWVDVPAGATVPVELGSAALAKASSG